MNEYRISYTYCNLDNSNAAQTSCYVKASSESDAKLVVEQKHRASNQKIKEWRQIVKTK